MGTQPRRWSRPFAPSGRELTVGLYRYTRVYRPRTNGKAERFIQTLLREWAYARSYSSSSVRTRALTGARPPISRVSHLCGHDS
jgi:transposase InsO family protein